MIGRIPSPELKAHFPMPFVSLICQFVGVDKWVDEIYLRKSLINFSVSLALLVVNLVSVEIIVID